jgi:uncharacterized protein involved in propanediol utilization
MPDAGAEHPFPGRGLGSCIAHHGEIFQGTVDGQGTRRPVLLSLPCPLYVSRARFVPRRGDCLIVQPGWRVKARRAAELTLALIGQKVRGGHLLIDSAIPPGWGLGSSTSDVVAAIRATAAAFDRQLSAEVVARLAVSAETASDSIIFGHTAVLFAHRQGVVLDCLGRQWPAIVVLGFNAHRAPEGMDTLACAQPHYSDEDRGVFDWAVRALRRAFEQQDVELLGRIASASASINQRYRPKPLFQAVTRMAERLGAAGVQVAHSGTVMGLIFRVDQQAAACGSGCV